MKIIVVTTENGPIFVNADHILRLTPVNCGLELDMVDSQVFEIRETLEHITRQVDEIADKDRAALVKAMYPLENAPPQPEPVAVEGDAISRAAAIEAMETLEQFKFREGGARLSGHDEVLRTLRRLPSLPCAQPEAGATGVDCWRDYDEERPSMKGIKVWARVEGRELHPSAHDPAYTVDFSDMKPCIEVLKTYRTQDGEIRINCAMSKRVTHWMPYREPEPPIIRLTKPEPGPSLLEADALIERLEKLKYISPSKSKHDDYNGTIDEVIDEVKAAAIESARGKA